MYTAHHFRCCEGWPGFWAIPALTLLLVGTSAVAAEPLERSMVRQAPGVIRYLRSKGYKNVGVLKFLVTKDGKKFSDNVGTLNMALANRLEIALILTNNPRDPVGLIRNASAVAARTKGANHLRREGRQKLFEANYPLAWGSREVKADAFITGVAQVSKDLRTLTISLLAFDRAKNKLVQVGKDFSAANEPDKLSEMGESFLLRGAFDDTSLEPGTPRIKAKALQAASRVKRRQAKNPLEDENPPVKLEVLYDGERVPIEFREGKAFVPEPKEGQKVAIILGRDDSKHRYGVVLKVNGENTLQRQRLPDLNCLKWVLDPGDKPITIRGYQMDDQTAQEFRVLSQAESEQNEVNYGADVGTITLTIFREASGKDPPPDLSDEAEYTTAVTLGDLPNKKAPNFHALKAQLLETANRGLIAEGQTIGSEVQRVKFKPDATPVMSVTIVYYRR